MYIRPCHSQSILLISQNITPSTKSLIRMNYIFSNICYHKFMSIKYVTISTPCTKFIMLNSYHQVQHHLVENLLKKLLGWYTVDCYTGSVTDQTAHSRYARYQPLNSFQHWMWSKKIAEQNSKLVPANIHVKQTKTWITSRTKNQIILKNLLSDFPRILRNWFWSLVYKFYHIIWYTIVKKTFQVTVKVRRDHY